MRRRTEWKDYIEKCQNFNVGSALVKIQIWDVP
jgi:hypothetical protein